MVDPHIEAELIHQPMSGVVRSSLYSVIFSLAVLLVGLVLVLISDDHKVPVEPEAGVAVVVLAAGLAGPLLSERAKHPLAVVLERPSRYTLYAVFLATYVAAGSVALEAEKLFSLGSWIGASGAALAAVALLAVQLRSLTRKWAGQASHAWTRSGRDAD